MDSQRDLRTPSALVQARLVRLRARRLFAGVLACAGIGVSLVTLAVTPPSAVALGGQPLLWGARVEKGPGQNDVQALDTYEASMGRQLGAVRIFLTWETPWPDSYANRFAANDQVPVMSVKPKRNNNQLVTWAEIASAVPGSVVHNEIVGWATKVKTFAEPLYFTFHHEAEATANLPYGTATEFIAAWRKVVDVFRSEGVVNAKYLWIATDFSFAVPLTERRAAASWFPGDAWVDALGADAYNWVNCRNRDEGWKSLQQIIEPFRQFGLAHPDKELWLPEFATVEDPADPLRKAQWINDATALFKQPGYEQFAGVSYFHYLVTSFPNCVWYVDSSPASTQAMAAMGADVYYGGEPQVVERTALFVVGNAVAPTTGETQAAAQIAALDAIVTFVDDDVVTAAEAATYDAVLVSSSVSSNFGARLRDIDTPLVVWKPWIYDDLRLTGPTAAVDYNSVAAPTLTVVDAAHPAAGGLTGPIPYSSSTVAIGQPTAWASIVASVGASPGLFVYNEGDAMFGGYIAPNCRIGFPQGTAALAATSPEGQQLFAATIDHALNNCTN